MRRSIWLLIGLVSSSHLVLLATFFNGGLRDRSSNSPAPRLSLQIVDVRSRVAAIPEIATPVPHSEPIQPPREPLEKLTGQLAEIKPAKTIEATPDSSADSNTPLSPFLDRSRFLDAAELDQSAATSNMFDPTLDQTLPATFDLIVLEFLIDETGQTVQLTCIDGDCSSAVIEKLQRLIVIPFTPATKNGRPVASRKVIQISPTPTFGL